MPPTGERLLTIGEFSRLSQLSIRMLRYYDDHDVLHPTRVDPWTGFRSYAPDLLRLAHWVRVLRDAGVGVAEMGGVMPHVDDPSALRAVLERQRIRLVDDAAGIHARIREVDHLITQLEVTMSIPVTTTTLPARTVASVRGTIPTYADEGLLWQRLMAGLGRAGVAPAPDARSVAVFHDDEYVEHDADVEVQLDVAGPFDAVDGVRCVEVPQTSVAVATLHGSYDGMGAATEALGRYTGEQGLRLAGPMFNVYRVGPMDAPDPADWVTEVCLPVADA
ncbi:MerR family transcriptional regulator [Actinotalea solisilvae]|uniref:MerR family transcriptional regulator n=1 Tax=Actinotalea solisilvae TaxID=2072922 RepID=UPI001F24DB0C|nr:MerR family transcriptional regulator [Actinotalea solisilvae]